MGDKIPLLLLERERVLTDAADIAAAFRERVRAMRNEKSIGGKSVAELLDAAKRRAAALHKEALLCARTPDQREML